MLKYKVLSQYFYIEILSRNSMDFQWAKHRLFKSLESYEPLLYLVAGWTWIVVQLNWKELPVLANLCFGMSNLLLLKCRIWVEILSGIEI